jgi:hypothetical protein
MAEASYLQVEPQQQANDWFALSISMMFSSRDTFSMMHLFSSITQARILRHNARYTYKMPTSPTVSWIKTNPRPPEHSFVHYPDLDAAFVTATAIVTTVITITITTASHILHPYCKHRGLSGDKPWASKSLKAAYLSPAPPPHRE